MPGEGPGAGGERGDVEEFRRPGLAGDLLDPTDDAHALVDEVVDRPGETPE
jgi:hypothetical protein